MKVFLGLQNTLTGFVTTDKVAMAKIGKTIDIIEHYIDNCHHGKEETFLFPALAKLNRPDVNQLVQDFQREHATGRDLLSQIKSEHQRLQRSMDSLPPQQLLHLAKQYIELLRHHVRKENLRLLPLIESEFSKRQQKELAFQFAQYEQKILPPEKQNAILRYIEQLA